jgi:hypothetical protein
MSFGDGVVIGACIALSGCIIVALIMRVGLGSKRDGKPEEK